MGNVLTVNKLQQIANRVPHSVRVLDVGCGVGILGRYLDGKQCDVTGYDLKLENISDYEKYYTLMSERNVEKEGLGNEKYDIIIFSDVLEHLFDGSKVLSQSRYLLNSGGKVLVSLPNVVYFENRLKVLGGNWDYTETGILAHAHIRFYTLATARKFLTGAGFEIREMEPEIYVIDSLWKRKLFSFLGKSIPTLFAVGWLFELE